MTLNVTLALGAAFLSLALFAGWRGARPPDPRKDPRLAPWRLIMLLSTAGAVMMLVHLLNLAGLATGGRQS